MLSDGLARGGPQEAANGSPICGARSHPTATLGARAAVTDRLLAFVPMKGSPAQAWFDTCRASGRPYDFNPLNINPLKAPDPSALVDFDAVRSHWHLKALYCRTNVFTGRLRVFPREKMNRPK